MRIRATTKPTHSIRFRTFFARRSHEDIKATKTATVKDVKMLLCGNYGEVIKKTEAEALEFGRRKKRKCPQASKRILLFSKVSERALMKTRILAINPANWLQMATSTTKLTHNFVWLAWFGSLVLHQKCASLRSAQFATKERMEGWVAECCDQQREILREKQEKLIAEANEAIRLAKKERDEKENLAEKHLMERLKKEKRELNEKFRETAERQNVADKSKLVRKQSSLNVGKNGGKRGSMLRVGMGASEEKETDGGGVGGGLVPVKPNKEQKEKQFRSRSKSHVLHKALMLSQGKIK